MDFLIIFLRLCSKYYEVTVICLLLSADSGTVTPHSHTNKFTVVEVILFLNQPHAGVPTSDQSTSQPARPWKMLNIISECQKNYFLPHRSVALRKVFSGFTLIFYSSWVQVFVSLCSVLPAQPLLCLHNISVVRIKTNFFICVVLSRGSGFGSRTMIWLCWGFLSVSIVFSGYCWNSRLPSSGLSATSSLHLTLFKRHQLKVEVFVCKNVWNTMDNISWRKNGHLKRKEPLPSAATLGFKSLVLQKLRKKRISCVTLSLYQAL
jgi:hypothetical protein